MKMSNKRKLVFSVLFISLALFFFEIYRAIYPGDAFYQAEFEQIAGREFPASGHFVFKEASFPDFHGDYVSCAIFTVTAIDYADLSRHIQEHKSPYSVGEAGSDCLHNLVAAYGSPLTFALEAREEGPLDEYRHWGLLDDGKSVMFHYVNW